MDILETSIRNHYNQLVEVERTLLDDLTSAWKGKRMTCNAFHTAQVVEIVGFVDLKNLDVIVRTESGNRHLVKPETLR